MTNEENCHSTTEPFISIIMPVYNAEKYVGEAIDSILSQDFSDFELLCVDDGSSDSSGAILDSYAARDERVFVLHQKNAGVCAARNAGIAQSSGTYVGFCDNDDIYLEGWLACMYEVAQGAACPDVITYARRRECYDSRGRLVFSSVASTPRASLSVRGGDDIFFALISYPTTGVWSHIYKRSLLVDLGILFNQGMTFNEDVLFNLYVADACSSMEIVPEVYYVFQQRQSQSTSMSHRVFNAQIINMNVFALLDAKRELMRKHGLDSKHPKVYAWQLLFPSLVVISLAAPIMSPASFKKEISQVLYDYYLPYKTELGSFPMSKISRICFWALMHRHFRLLYDMAKWGTNVKQLLRLDIKP